MTEEFITIPKGLDCRRAEIKKKKKIFPPPVFTRQERNQLWLIFGTFAIGGVFLLVLRVMTGG